MAPRAGNEPGSSTGPDGSSDGPGEAYSRFQEGSRLLDSGNTHAAVVALERARELEPEKGSIREALARAYFRSQRVEAARAEFEKVLELDPVNDYAHFGLGLCLLRSGDRDGARGHLKIATIMRPDEEAYQDALRQASA
ncbi:MAG TPA: tetratricopeptide repeat protein [Acidimicrobiia bacterium]|nr:tetratricopeptide repeat protein [Acidimicrobiia bacterium]HZQ80050.1 tetratricopeptide repeat protein [Acidimicrobiia bacterium]